jgi:hypothetical protein
MANAKTFVFLFAILWQRIKKRRAVMPSSGKTALLLFYFAPDQGSGPVVFGFPARRLVRCAGGLRYFFTSSFRAITKLQVLFHLQVLFQADIRGGCAD